MDKVGDQVVQRTALLSQKPAKTPTDVTIDFGMVLNRFDDKSDNDQIRVLVLTLTPNASSNTCCYQH